MKFLKQSIGYVVALLVICSLAYLMTGCAGLATLVSPAAMPMEQAAVGAAVYTAETANHVSPAEQVARAVKINQIAKEILAVDQSASMALADVEIIVNAKIQALNLPPPDMLVASLLTAALGQALQAQLAVTTKGAISPQTQIAVATVCSWIIADTGG